MFRLTAPCVLLEPNSRGVQSPQQLPHAPFLLDVIELAAKVFRRSRSRLTAVFGAVSDRTERTNSVQFGDMNGQSSVDIDNRALR